jgi:hypothetical protein
MPKAIKLDDRNIGDYFDLGFVGAMARRAGLDARGAPHVPDDSPLLTELIAWVERHNTPSTRFTLTRPEAARILCRCHPTNFR